MSQSIQLIVGLGNPGPEYDKTRHNAGAWFVEKLAESSGQTLRSEAKFHGTSCRINFADHDVRLLIPTTFMNHSGQAIKAIASFYKINPEEILVAHDELDLPAGEVRLKQDGGHGGHNGLRDTINHLGSKNFFRLRLGIGHPGHSDQVIDYVLNRPSKSDHQQILNAIDDGLFALPTLLSGQTQEAMKQLHTKKG